MDRDEKRPEMAGQDDAVSDEAETPLRQKDAGPAPKFNLDEVLPPRYCGKWPEGLSLRREDMYEDRA